MQLLSLFAHIHDALDPVLTLYVKPDHFFKALSANCRVFAHFACYIADLSIDALYLLIVPLVLLLLLI